tara:strand:- start:1982 stop:2296 length:315 start_codon:yes stop_codon:yes gene_type:complete
VSDKKIDSLIRVGRLDIAKIICRDRNVPLVLRGASLFDAKLEGADLRRMDLYGADLFRANLCGADLRGADLRGADLRESCLDDAKLAGARHDERTHWPEGFTPT